MHSAPAPLPRDWQSVLNESWPPGDAARGLVDRSDAIPVQVRVVFASDGEAWLDGVATRWWQRHVFVRVESEVRLQLPFVWVDADDVRRR